MPRAARQCPAPGCDTLIRNQPYCEAHTVPWTGGRTASSKVTSKRIWREQFLPMILERDAHQCQIRYQGICNGRATTSDKIIPAARRPDLAMDPTNNRAACAPCNDHKARTEDRRPAR